MEDFIITECIFPLWSPMSWKIHILQHLMHQIYQDILQKSDISTRNWYTLKAMSAAGEDKEL